MILTEKITEKEKSVKNQLEQLRNILNSQSKFHSQNPNSWVYLTSLTHTDNKLKELIAYLNSTP